MLSSTFLIDDMINCSGAEWNGGTHSWRIRENAALNSGGPVVNFENAYPRLQNIVSAEQKE